MTPYRTTAVFDETTLPPALRREHRTKKGVWGVVRLLEGELRLLFPDGRVEVLDPCAPGLVRPEETHWVEPVGPMRMQVEFYESEPAITRS
jgi:tellurite resistance-related uncharacterized protein